MQFCELPNDLFSFHVYSFRYSNDKELSKSIFIIRSLMSTFIDAVFNCFLFTVFMVHSGNEYFEIKGGVDAFSSLTDFCVLSQ